MSLNRTAIGKPLVIDVEVQEGGGMAVEQFSDLCNSILSIGPGKVRIIVVPEKICSMRGPLFRSRRDVLRSANG